VAASATRGFGLAARIFVTSTVVVVAVLMASLGLTFLQARRTADEAIGTVLRRNRIGLATQLRARADGLAGMSAVSAGVPQFRERLVGDPDLANRVDQAEEYRDLVGAAWVLVTDAEGVLLARTDYPQESGADLSRGALIADALGGEQTRGAFIDDRDPDSTRLFFAVATPLTSEGAAPQGVLVTSFALDDNLAADLAGQMGADLAFFALDRGGKPVVVASTLPRDAVAGALAVRLNVARLDSLDSNALATEQGVDTLAAEIDGEHYIGLPLPLRSAAGDLFGGVVAFRPRGAELAAFHALRNMIWVSLGVGVALALVSAALLGRQIASPVRRLVAATHRVQDGDYSVEIPTAGSDEVGALARAFQSLVNDLKEKQQLVEYVMAASGGAATQPLQAAPTAVRQAVGAGTGPIEPGSVFAGRYEIKEILGMGGMGVVYRAMDRELGEPVAIKTLRTEVVGSDGIALERFKQEIRLARKITHRNVVRTYDLGETNGTYYITMEFVEGTSLKQLIQSRGRLPVPVTLTIGKQLCRALEVAHEQGVIHRDIKPQNIVVEPNGFLKVMDFGIARLATAPQGKGLTEVGTAIGTPDYMSPEQLLGEELDPRSDLYSAGVVLYECLTGRPAFVADTVYALVAKHLEEEPLDPRELNAEVSPPLAQLVLRAMAKQRDDRYQSAAELHDALAEIG
jgi:serine/threonine-protein kinase